MASKAFETRSKSFYCKVSEYNIMEVHICVCPDISHTKRSHKFSWFTGNHLAAVMEQLQDVILAKTISNVTTCGKDSIQGDFKIASGTDSSFYVQYIFKKRPTKQCLVIQSPASCRSRRLNPDSTYESNYSGGGYKDFAFHPDKLVVTVRQTENSDKIGSQDQLVDTRTANEASTTDQPISRYFTSSLQDAVTCSAVKKRSNLSSIVKKMELTEITQSESLDVAMVTANNDEVPPLPALPRDTCLSRDSGLGDNVCWTVLRDPCSSRDSGLGDSVCSTLSRGPCSSRDSGLGDSVYSTISRDPCSSRDSGLGDSMKGTVQNTDTAAPITNSINTCTAKRNSDSSVKITCANGTTTSKSKDITCVTSMSTCSVSTDSTSSLVDASRKRPRVESDDCSRHGSHRLSDGTSIDEDEDFRTQKTLAKNRHKKRKKGTVSSTAADGTASKTRSRKLRDNSDTASKTRSRMQKSSKAVNDATNTTTCEEIRSQRADWSRELDGGTGDTGGTGELGDAGRKDDTHKQEAEAIVAEGDAANCSGSNRTEAITISDVEPDFTNISEVADLTADHIDYLVNKMAKELKRVFSGKTYCRRHEDYKKGGRSRGDLAFQVRFGLFSDDQQHAIMSSLITIFCSRNTKYLDYVTKVLLPETFVLIYTRLFGGSRDEVEHLLMDREPSSNQQITDDSTGTE